MNSAERGADAGVLFDEVYAALQIVAAEENVIEHGWHLIDERHVGFLLVLSAKSTWGQYCASS